MERKGQAVGGYQLQHFRNYFYLLRGVYFQAGPLVYAKAAGLLATTLLSLLTMHAFSSGPLGWGWLGALFGGGGGIGTRIMLEIGKLDGLILYPALGVTLGIAIVIAPGLARVEEIDFRAGAIETPQILKKSVLFGLVHTLAGIPLYAAIALCVPGALLGWEYQRNYRQVLARTNSAQQASDDALSRCITIHAIHNALAFGVLTLALVIHKIR